LGYIARRALTDMSCVICAAADARLWCRAGAYDLYRCEHCGVVFTDPLPTQRDVLRLYGAASYFDGGGAGGYVTGYDVTAQSQSLLYETILDELGPPKLGAILLEVGCAEGHFLAAARGRNWEVCGVEVSPIAAASARRRFGIHVIEGTLEEHHLEPTAYDVIVLLDVIEHLRDPMRVVRTAASLLKPDGRIVIKTPDIGSAQARRLGARWPHIKPPEHLVYFDVPSITFVLQACGFEIDKREAVGGTGVLVALRRLLGPNSVLDYSRSGYALVAAKRWRWLAWLVAKISAAVGRQDGMIVFARRVPRYRTGAGVTTCGR